MEDQFDQPKAVQEGLGIKDMFYKYIFLLPLIFLSVALSLIIAFLYLRYAEPIYQSTGAIMIKDKKGVGGGENDRFRELFVLDNSMDIQNEMEIMQSKELMERVVDSLDLNFSYYVLGNINEQNIYTNSPFYIKALEINDSSSSFTLDFKFEDENSFKVNEDNKIYQFSQTFENEKGVFLLVRKPYGSIKQKYKVTWRPTSTIASSLSSQLAIVPKGSTGILTVSLEAPHPKLAADIINMLMKEYQVITIEDKNETTRQTVKFIDERLNDISKELDSITSRLLAYQVEHNLVNAASQSSTYYSKITGNEGEINRLQTQKSIALMIKNYLGNPETSYDVVPSTLGLGDGTLSSMIGAYNGAQLERKELLDANLPETNLKVKQKEALIERLRINILESLRNLQASFEASISRLQSEINKARLEVESLPAKEQNLEEIKKQQQLKQTVFNLLMEKREESAISLAATISNTKVVEGATANLTPVKPNKNTIRLIAIVLGLAIPVALIVLKEVLNDKISSRADIERATNVPIVGEVGHSFNKDALVVRSNNRSYIAEQFRIIRSNLQYILPSVQKPVLLVTSSFSGEGKSFISTNLAAVLSLANKKTIVLEFDIRKPKILSHLGIPKKVGLTNYLLGKISAEDLPIEVSGFDSNFYVLACGPIPPNPSELLLDPKIKELFLYLKEKFDVVVIDTAPIGMVSDAMTLSAYADATLYIVRQEHTFKKQIALIDEFYREKKLPRLSIILNDVKVRSGYGYSYGRYGYGQGYGYFEDDTAPSSAMTRWFGWANFKNGKKKTNSKKIKV